MRILLLLAVYGLVYSALLARRGAHPPAGPQPPSSEPPPAPPRRVLVLGATGGTGRELVAQALARGLDVTAFVRDPARLGITHERLRVVTGDALDPAAVDAAVRGQDAVLCALGHRQYIGPTSVLSRATANVIAAMQRGNVRKIVVETALGLGASAYRMGAWYTFIVLPLVLPFYFWDKARQEQAVARSGLAWTLVRPAALTDGPATGSYRVGGNVGGYLATPQIARADVAAFMLDQLASDAWRERAPGLGR